MLTYDVRTGRPLHDGDEAVDALSDEELEVELTVALLDVEHRQRRLDDLARELVHRRRGERPAVPQD